MSGAVTSAIRRSLEDGQALGLKGGPLRRYIEKDSKASGDLIDNFLQEFYADLTCQIASNMEVTFNAAATEAIQAGGLATGRSMPVSVVDGCIVIGDRE